MDNCETLIDKFLPVLAAILGAAVGFVLNFWAGLQREKEQNRRLFSVQMSALLDEVMANKSLLNNMALKAPRLRQEGWFSVLNSGVLRWTTGDAVHRLRDFYQGVLAYNEQVAIFLDDQRSPGNEIGLRDLRANLAPLTDEVIELLKGQIRKFDQFSYFL